MAYREQLKKLQDDFCKKSTLSECLEIAKKATSLHGFFQHYTSLECLVSMIVNREFWLTRGDSVRLDDQLEWRKYGNKAEWRRTFIGCFSHGTTENAAMWGLYGPKSHLSVRLSIPRETMLTWIDWLGTPGGKPAFCKSARRPRKNGAKIEEFSVSFGDLVYLAVDDGDRYDRKRGDTAAWFNVATDKPIPGLANQLLSEKVIGWVKDYEWKDERESRIVFKTSSGVSSSSVAIQIQPNVLETMSITFSPWATDHEIDSMTKMLKTIMFKSDVKREKSDRFKRSFLSGALQKWERR